MRARKYRTENLVPMLIKAAALRNEMCSAGFTDNGVQFTVPNASWTFWACTLTIQHWLTAMGWRNFKRLNVRSRPLPRKPGARRCR